MLRRSFLLVTPASLATGTAWAQTNIVPDPTPRLPPQAGQRLPVEDVRFLRDAALLSSTLADAAAPVAERAAEEEIRPFAARVAERHRPLAQKISVLARQRDLEQEMRALGSPEVRVAGALRRLEEMRDGAAAEGRTFLATQLDVYPVLVEMYQTQASHTTDRELSSFAITTMAGLQEEFAAAARLGSQFGLSPPERLLGNPPQYGPGAGPSR